MIQAPWHRRRRGITNDPQPSTAFVFHRCSKTARGRWTWRVHRWLTEELSEEACELIGAAMLEILQEEGPNVCGTRFGRQLGDGVFEFRLDGDPQAWIDQARAKRGSCPLAAASEVRRSNTASSVMRTATGLSCFSVPTTKDIGRRHPVDFMLFTT
jgi:hypothetical protein